MWNQANTQFHDQLTRLFRTMHKWYYDHTHLTSHIQCILYPAYCFQSLFFCFQWIKRNKSEQSDFQTASNHKISLKLVLSIRWINNKPYYIYDFKWIHWEIHWKISRKKFQLSLVNRKFHWNNPTTTHFSPNKNAQFWWHFAYPYLDLS